MRLLKHLNLIQCDVDANTKGETLFHIFEKNDSWPGVIVKEDELFLGMISRDHFFEFSGKQFGRELIYKRTLKDFFSYTHADHLILDESITFSEAVTKVLDRKKDTYGPITVLSKNGEHYLLNVHDLFLAHSRQHVELMKELQDTNKFKTELIHIVSHDLKNPLSIVQSYAEIISHELNPQSEEYTMCRSLIEKTFDMHELIMTFLDKNDEEFNMDLVPKRFDLMTFLRKNIRDNQPYTAIKSQALNLTLPEDLEEIIIEADFSKLKSVMDNLLSNAIKFSETNTEINVKMEIRNNFALCSIADQGQGVAENDKEKIFKKFQKSIAKPTQGESSTGLGLYFTRWIIKMHRGDIWVENNEHGGATFVFRIPIISHVSKELNTTKD